MAVSISTVVGSGPFVPIEDATEMRRGDDGAIVIEAYGKEFVGPELWDEIDQLWLFFLQGINDVSHTGSSEWVWPCQYIKLVCSSFDASGETYVEMRLDLDPETPRKVKVKLAELRKAAGDAALIYFDVAERLDPGRRQKYRYDAYKELIAEWQSQDEADNGSSVRHRDGRS